MKLYSQMRATKKSLENFEFHHSIGWGYLPSSASTAVGHSAADPEIKGLNPASTSANMEETNGLYYKHMTIVNDDSSIVIK
jgi:hypothetical protein